MHVGLNLVYLRPDSGGPGTYARELVRALPVVDPDLRITAWISRDAPAELVDAEGAVSWVRVPVRAAGSPVHVAVELLALGLDARRRGVDVVHGLAYAAPVVAPGVATVVTMFDVTWLTHRDAVGTRAHLMFRLLARACGRRADRVITVSEFAKSELIERVGIDGSRISVTPLAASRHARDGGAPAAISPPSIVATLPPSSRVLLVVGQLAGHKNLARLVDAVATLGRDVVLVLAGRHVPGTADVLDRARRRGVAVIAPGWLPDAEIDSLFEAADALVLPSLAEGFGLPVIEAMARRVPVACARAGALPEVVGDAALLFDPTDTADIASACRRVLDDAELRRTLVERGRERAGAFTWEACATATLAAYQRAVADAARS